jgi:hypothetical protein
VEALKTQIVPPGWKYPLAQDLIDVWDAAYATPYGAHALAVPGLAGTQEPVQNIWNMNFACFGRNKWHPGDSWEMIGPFNDAIQKNFVFSHDYLTSAEPYNVHGSCIDLAWQWGDHDLYHMGDSYSWIAVRLIYIGDDL